MNGERRHHTIVLALVALAFVGTAAVAVNDWLQRDWLAAKWLGHAPHALGVLAGSAAIGFAALVALALAWRGGRWRGASWAPLRWLAPALGGAWMSTWSILPPPLVHDAHPALAAAAAAWCVCVAADAWWSRRRRSRSLLALDWLLFHAALGAFALEGALRAARAVRPAPWLATAGTDVDAWLASYRLPPGSFHLGFSVNSDGFVDEEPERVAASPRRVVCLGDSFSVGVVPHHRHYTTLAEASFDGLAIYNLGVAGAGPREYARLFERHGRDLAPDLVVVALFLGNDVQDSARRDASGLVAWMDRREVLIRELPRRLWAARGRSGAAEVDAGADTFGVPATLGLAPVELERRLAWLEDPLAEPPVLDAKRHWYVETTRLGILDPARRGDYDALFARLDELVDLVAPAPLAFLLFPDVFQVEEPLWRELGEAGLTRGAVRELPQTLVAARLDELGLAYVDLLPRLRAVAPLADGERHVYHRCDSHFNARGNRVAADALAELVERAGVAPRARPLSAPPGR